MRIPFLSLSALTQVFREPARPNPKATIAALLTQVENRACEAAPAFDAMVAEIERTSGLQRPQAERATFDVIEHLLSCNQATQAALRGLAGGLPVATLHHVARPGARGDGPARAVIDDALVETLQARTARSRFDPERYSDADIGDLGGALRCLRGTDQDGEVGLQVALRKVRTAAPFREALSVVFASTNDVDFFRHLDVAQGRFQAVLEAWCVLGERVEGGDGTAEAHYALVRDFADRQDVASLRDMLDRLERPDMLACRDAIALAGQVLLLADPPEEEAARAIALFHLASLGMLNLASAVADSLEARVPGFRQALPARNGDAGPLTDAQCTVLEQALGLTFAQGDRLAPRLSRTTA